MSINISLSPESYIDKKFKLILPEDEDQRIINIDGIDYLIELISNRGSNSYILGLIDVGSESASDYSLVIKVCKIPLFLRDKDRRVKRFEFEIEALKKCREHGLHNVVEIFDSGVIKIMRQDSLTDYSFYLMEYADYDLTRLLETKKLEIIDKIELCLSIAKSFNQLHKMEYYHRDIKNDNILFCNGVWKIGDLGLLAMQDEDKNIDLSNEKIGPYGWLSPEVMNKVLTEKKDGLEFSFDCKIDLKSDIFQLGKLFWYIFQSNLPIGGLKYEEDFKIKDIEIFNLINLMLQYSKTRRPDLDIVESMLLDIHKNHANPSLRSNSPNSAPTHSFQN